MPVISSECEAIQFITTEGTEKTLWFSVPSVVKKDWIPACAGMTISLGYTFDGYTGWISTGMLVIDAITAFAWSSSLAYFA